VSAAHTRGGETFGSLGEGFAKLEVEGSLVTGSAKLEEEGSLVTGSAKLEEKGSLVEGSVKLERMQARRLKQCGSTGWQRFFLKPG
jgi:hypothetical protein